MKNVSYVENRCPPPPLVENATLTGNTDTAKGATVTFACIPGHRFPTGAQRKSIVCSGTAWSEDYLFCSRKLASSFTAVSYIYICDHSYTFVFYLCS